MWNGWNFTGKKTSFPTCLPPCPGSSRREISPALTRILAASNRIDKVTTINQMLLNSLSGYSDFRTLYEANSPQLTRAEELWKLRKEELRQKAIDRSKKKQEGGES